MVRFEIDGTRRRHEPGRATQLAHTSSALKHAGANGCRSIPNHDRRLALRRSGRL